MERLEALRTRLPDAAKDIRVNLQSVLQPGGALNGAQRFGVALAAAYTVRDRERIEALESAARSEAGETLVEDARAAAVLMAMNNVYYRFRHLIGKPGYSQKPARLRMSRMAQPATNKLDFELFSLAVSAINACETCVQAHEKVVLDGGLTDEHVHDAVRIAATIAATAVAASIPSPIRAPSSATS